MQDVCSSSSQRTFFNDLQQDCVQSVVDFLTLSEGFKLLTHISKKYREFRLYVAVNNFSDVERRTLLKRLLSKNILRGCVMDFHMSGLKLLCSDVMKCIYTIELITPSIVSTVTYVEDEHTVLTNPTLFLGGKVSPKNCRSAKYLGWQKIGSKFHVELCAFQCTYTRPNGAVCTRSTYDTPCLKSFSIIKCSNIDCDQPYFQCNDCCTRCYDCYAHGLCTCCLYETPNSGEVVFVCAPCRGFCI